MTNYLAEAFKSLQLMEDEIPASEVDWQDKIKKFLDDDIDYDPEEEGTKIMDVQAEAEDELQSVYLNKVAVQCKSCHSNVYREPEEVHVDKETGVLEVGLDECPICNAVDGGWTLIGEIKPFDPMQEFPDDGAPVEPEGGEEVIGDEEVSTNPDDIPMEGEKEVSAEDNFDDAIEDEEDEFGEDFSGAFKEANGSLMNPLSNGDDVCPSCGKNPCQCADKHKERLEKSNLEESLLNEDNEAIMNRLRDKLMAGSRDASTELGEDAETDRPLEISDTNYIDDDTDNAAAENELNWLRKHMGGEKLTPADWNLKSMSRGEAARDNYRAYERRHGKSFDEACLREEDNETILNNLRDRLMADGESSSDDIIGEELLAHDNENFGLKKDYACDDDISLEDDQKDLVIKEEKCPECGDDIKSKDDMCDDCKEKAKKKEKMTEEVHIETTGEDSVNMTKGDDGSISLEVGAGFSEGEGEMIAPIDTDFASEIGAEADLEDATNSFDINAEGPAGEAAAEAASDAFGDAMEAEDEFIDDAEGEEYPEDEEEISDIDDFKEESFDYLGEAFAKKVYENVNSFKVSKVSANNKSLYVEGIVGFKSGKSLPSTFVFERLIRTKRGKRVLEGYNTMFSGSKKAFMLKGNLDNGAFFCESMIYNFSANSLNESNERESVKVYGRVRVPAK